MKKITAVILIFVSTLCLAQKRTYNLYFQKNQIQINARQKEELLKLAAQTKEDELVTIFPLTIDSMHKQYFFAGIADKQAIELAQCLRSIGFRIISTPHNFPSGFKGHSYSVNVRLINHVLLEVRTAQFAPKPSQFFLINPKRDTMLTGNEGTKMHFPSGCLRAHGMVMVELKEHYAMADYVKYDLPSTSGGKMIESGGVIYLNAKEKKTNKQVQINPDKPVGLEFTLGKNKSNMQVFMKDPTTRETNWVLQDSIRSRQIWRGTETIYDADNKIISQKTYTSKAEWDKHLKEVEEEMKKEELERQKIEKREKLQMQAAVQKNKTDKMLQLYNFGFINCDRFINEPQKPFQVKLNEATSANYYLVFNDIRGVMSGTVNQDLVDFGSVPVNKKATLIAIAFEGKQAFYCSNAIVTNQSQNPKIDMKPVDEAFINGQLAKLK